MYHANLTTNQVETAAPQTLTEESLRLCNRLVEILQHVEKIGDGLIGPRPQEVKQGGNPTPVPTISRNIEGAHEIAGLIENAISRIEMRL